jgi:hypothetical protein
MFWTWQLSYCIEYGEPPYTTHNEYQSAPRGNGPLVEWQDDFIFPQWPSYIPLTKFSYRTRNGDNK